jgi:hypothetical protein
VSIVSESLHMRLEALCAAMQRHGVLVCDLDKLRLFVNSMLDETERRLSEQVRTSPLSIRTVPSTPSSITQRLRALADEDEDDS